MKMNVVHSTQLPMVCDFCGGNHIQSNCEESSSMLQEQLNYMGNSPKSQNNPSSTTCNLGW